ncbi:hypothetical protein O156_gp54 [Mycobacterium phage LittleCherry]|uniref:Uncharacterized protein n=1 Tax=Mycobacterium phage LittleCherry TaxID=1340818 RepID=S5YKG7_9CAUD|nr:hypothetical protein O156_gp54 [Mycobacterium phage LittleCherry]AGT11923.1 hypothetical protein PBI_LITTLECHERRY_40 [Mycobacterium phage LittleCherry]
MNNLEIAEIVEKAHDEMAARGRTTGNLIDPETCEVCLLGAVGVAGIGEEELKKTLYEEFYYGGKLHPVVKELVKDLPDSALQAMYGSTAPLRSDLFYDDLYHFNDTHATTEQVLDLFKTTAKRLKEAA